MKSIPLRVPEDVVRDLSLLKLAWKKKTYGEVLRELLRSHQLDKLKAFGIQIPEGDLQGEAHP